MQHWSPSDVVTIIAALTAFAVSIINALRNTETKTRSEDNQDRINSLARHVQGHDQQLTTLALSIPTAAAGTGTAVPDPGIGGSNQGNGINNPTNLLATSQDDLIAPQGASAEEPQ